MYQCVKDGKNQARVDYFTNVTFLWCRKEQTEALKCIFLIFLLTQHY